MAPTPVRTRQRGKVDATDGLSTPSSVMVVTRPASAHRRGGVVLTPSRVAASAIR